jgi:solute carrier family 35 (UDP-sugar transporter), member A1/2/3
MSVSERAAAKKSYFLSGIVPILTASLISGLAGAWTQRSLRGISSNSLLFTLQLSVFSILLMGTTLIVPGLSPDRERGMTEGWSVGWTLSTWIPIAVNAAGGVLVGLVTKFSGVVPKGFALIVGMFLSGVLQNMFSGDKQVTAHQWVGGLLAAVSVWMHAAYPYTATVAP